jgi:GntP family gluconate:H+ symporter
MTICLLALLISLVAGIACMIMLAVNCRVHALLALLIASVVVGSGTPLPVPDVINTIKEGFGNIMKSLGFSIVRRTALGVLPEHGGSTGVMAAYIPRTVGEHQVTHVTQACILTGSPLRLPVACGAGYIVLRGLNRSPVRRTGISIVMMAASLLAYLSPFPS